MLSLLTLAYADNRLLLFDQSAFGAKKGWYFAFENQGTDGTPLPVGSLRLILAVADGKEWRFIESKGFRFGQSLDVRSDLALGGVVAPILARRVDDHPFRHGYAFAAEEAELLGAEAPTASSE